MAAFVNCNGLRVFGHFAITTNRNILLAIGFFDRSKTSQRGIVASLGKKKLAWKERNMATASKDGGAWNGIFTPCFMGRDRFTYTLAISPDVGKNFLLTTAETEYEDIYNYLMEHYKLPLLKDWIPTLVSMGIQKRCFVKESLRKYKGEGNGLIFFELNNRNVELDSITCYNFEAMTDENFEWLVSTALKGKHICITQKHMQPLKFKTFDDYITNYGTSLVDNLNKKIQPLTGLNPNVETLALKTKHLFPQQAASVNGVLAMMDNGLKSCVLNMGMGTGKTIQAASVIESAMVKKWLKSHPGKTLRDAYEPGVIKYRAIIMAPGHLVDKWCEEITEEIPYAKCEILHGGLSQLVRLRERGRAPEGKEFYILSKDFAKLDTWQSPIPTSMKKKYFSLSVCKDCAEEHGKIHYKKGHGPNAACPSCTGNNFMNFPLLEEGKFFGLVCPECGELLIKNKGYDPSSDTFRDSLDNYVLTPQSFSKCKSENLSCYHCGASLWGVNSKPLVDAFSALKDPKWYKVSHFSNHAKKTKTTSFVLKGHEEDYYNTCITIDGLEKSSQIYGPRKVAPARFIKKYLKGFFDFCVLDEAHKYLGDSAQGVAAHSLIKASRFTLALTGTISNGTAESFFNLFWMLDPKAIKSMGYEYTKGDLIRFCKEYGCVETVYECSSSGNGNKNSMSRGRQLSPPRVKPGISPVIFGRLLMDKCLFLDLSDLSKYLPKFTESVCLLPIPDELISPYNSVISTLKEESQTGCGMGVLSTMLQFGSSYLDKPYSRLPIMHPFKKDILLVRPHNFEKYEEVDNLLPKEKKLISLINEEISSGRNCFVYASFTGKAETNVSWRLKDLIERHCNLSGRVEIIQSSSPAASKREAWFHKRASEGIKVFITNPANVETGLDFCFKYDGVVYNYPTLIFYQTGYSLSTIWQASRRAYRLNQKEECRNYYLAYERTLQAAALEIMAKKQTATAAIQGKFSSEGLAAMAKGVDTRTQLAAALAKNDMSSRESLENMFDALNTVVVDDDDSYSAYVPSLTYYELMGVSEEKTNSFAFDFESSFENSFCNSVFEEGLSEWLGVKPENAFAPIVGSESIERKEELNEVFNFEASFGFFNPFGFSLDGITAEGKNKDISAKKKKVKGVEGQSNLLDFLTI